MEFTHTYGGYTVKVVITGGNAQNNEMRNVRFGFYTENSNASIQCNIGLNSLGGNARKKLSQTIRSAFGNPKDNRFGMFITSTLNAIDQRVEEVRKNASEE